MGQNFSIEINSKMNIDKIILNDSNEGILFEGDLGVFRTLSLIEDTLLELQFSNGTLRLEIDESMLDPILTCLSVSQHKK